MPRIRPVAHVPVSPAAPPKPATDYQVGDALYAVNLPYTASYEKPTIKVHTYRVLHVEARQDPRDRAFDNYTLLNLEDDRVVTHARSDDYFPTPLEAAKKSVWRVKHDLEHYARPAVTRQEAQLALLEAFVLAETAKDAAAKGGA